MFKRKIIQLLHVNQFGLMVLCDDETVWNYPMNGKEWERQELPPIPQPKENINV